MINHQLSIHRVAGYTVEKIIYSDLVGVAGYVRRSKI